MHCRYLRFLAFMVALWMAFGVISPGRLLAEGDANTAGGHGGHGSTSPIPFDPDLAIVTAIVFLILLAILGKFAWKPIMEGLAKREEGIARNIEEARRTAEEATARLQEYEGKLATAASEAQDMIATARKQAEAAGERIVADGRAAAERERQRAIEDIHTAKETALSEIAQQSVNSAVALAGRLVQKEIKAEDHENLIRDAVSKLPSQN